MWKKACKFSFHHIEHVVGWMLSSETSLIQGLVDLVLALSYSKCYLSLLSSYQLHSIFSLSDLEGFPANRFYLSVAFLYFRDWARSQICCLLQGPIHELHIKLTLAWKKSQLFLKDSNRFKRFQHIYVWKSFWVFQTLLIWQCLLRSSKREEPNILNSAYPSIEGLLNCQCTT